MDIYRDNNLVISGSRVSYRTHAPTIMASHLGSSLWSRFSEAFFSRFCKLYVPEDLKTREYVKHVFRNRVSQSRIAELRSAFDEVSKVQIKEAPRIEDAEIDQIVDGWKDDYGLRNTKAIISTALSKSLLSGHCEEGTIRVESEDIEYAKDRIGIYLQGERKLSELRNEDQSNGVEQEIFLKLIERGDPIDSLVSIFGKHRATLYRWKKSRLSQVA